MPTAKQDNDLYEVILIYSGVGYAALCPGIPGAVSQGTDQEDRADNDRRRHGHVRMYPLPDEEKESRREELRELGKAKIAELAAECERDGWQYEVHQVAPQLISPPVLAG